MIAGGVGNRIKHLRQENGLSQLNVAQKLYISQSAYSLLETSRNSLTPQHIIRLSELYDVPTDYILKGNTKLIEMNVKNGFMPFLHKKAHAGFLEKIREKKSADDFEYYRIPGFNPTKDTMLIEVEGNSMLPTISSGDILICQLLRNMDYLIDNSITVIALEDKIISARIQKHENDDYLWMLSDNPDHTEKIKIRKKDILRIYSVLGKASTVLIPHGEMAFRGKLKTLEEKINWLNKELYHLKGKLQYKN